jgi:hypothetical protein
MQPKDKGSKFSDVYPSIGGKRLFLRIFTVSLVILG